MSIASPPARIGKDAGALSGADVSCIGTKTRSLAQERNHRRKNAKILMAGLT
jgi:hypothetical protein